MLWAKRVPVKCVTNVGNKDTLAKSTNWSWITSHDQLATNKPAGVTGRSQV